MLYINLLKIESALGRGQHTKLRSADKQIEPDGCGSVADPDLDPAIGSFRAHR